MGDTMRALALPSFEEPFVVTDVPAPEAGPGEVLVRVGAASVNAYDTFVAKGAMRDYLPYVFPAVLGTDVAGTVEALGAGVSGFAVGQRVFGTIGDKASVHDGAFAELASANADALAATPHDVDDVRAGSRGVAGTTALNAVEAIAPEGGSIVLILGPPAAWAASRSSSPPNAAPACSPRSGPGTRRSSPTSAPWRPSTTRGTWPPPYASGTPAAWTR
jgi:NADPH:quinone reductase-like Zn-dependent oxidoreductase